MPFSGTRTEGKQLVNCASVKAHVNGAVTKKTSASGIKFMHSSCAQEALLYLRILRVRRSLNSAQNQQDRQLLVLRIIFLVLVLGFHVVGID